MTLPAAYNEISMSQINVEAGFGATALITLNDAIPRIIAGVPSGEINMNNFHGKTYVPLAASAAPASVSGFGFDFGGGVDIYSDDATCTASGGSGGYTYQWQHVSGSTFNIAPPANNTPGVQFWYTLYGFQTRTGVYRCSVNDSSGTGPVYTGNVTITLDSEA